MNNTHTIDDTTVDRDTWLQIMKDKSFDESISGGYHVSIDFEVEELLKDVIVAYAEGPVGYYNDKVFEVYSRGFRDIKYVNDFKKELLEAGHTIIFFMAVRHDVREEFRDKEGYKLLPQHWYMRYKIV